MLLSRLMLSLLAMGSALALPPEADRQVRRVITAAQSLYSQADTVEPESCPSRRRVVLRRPC